MDIFLPVNLHECAYVPVLLCAVSCVHSPTGFCPNLSILSLKYLYNSYYCINYLLIYNLKDL